MGTLSWIRFEEHLGVQLRLMEARRGEPVGVAQATRVEVPCPS